MNKDLLGEAYNLYFWAREESHNYQNGSGRRERFVLLALRAFARYERRHDNEWREKRENSPPQKPCQAYRPMKSMGAI